MARAGSVAAIVMSSWERLCRGKNWTKRKFMVGDRRGGAVYPGELGPITGHDIIQSSSYKREQYERSQGKDKRY